MDGIILTEQGKRLSVEAAASNKAVRILRVSIGSGMHEEDYIPEEMTELVEYKMDGMISKCEADGDTVSLTAQFSSLETEKGFYAMEIGVYAAEDTDGAEELLFAYFDMATDPQYIYGSGEGVQKLVEINMAMVLSNTNKITANICPDSIIYREEFSKEILEIKGRITDLEYPEYEEAGELEEIKSSDGIKRILGKVKRALRELILHIENKENPHIVTPEQLGIEAGANNYIHPNAHPASMITQDENHRFVTDTQTGSWNGKMEKTGDSAENAVTFTSGDSASPVGWTDVAVMASGEKHKSLFNKLSTMAKNVRWLYKMLGTTNIASIGGGTLTGAISALNTGLAGKQPLLSITNYVPFNTVTVPSGTPTSIGSVTLDPGTYLMVSFASFTANSSGTRRIVVSTAQNTDAAGRNGTLSVAASPSGVTVLNHMGLPMPGSRATYYLTVYQTSGSPLTVYGGYGLIKLK